MKKIDLKFGFFSKEMLKECTGNMTTPCIFYNFPVVHDLDSCTVDEILSLGKTDFLSSTHNGSYWSDKPLYTEIQGRKKRLNLKRMFIDNIGDYYVTYFQPTETHASGWKTIRTCGNNEFDNYLAQRTKFLPYMKGSSLHNHWISNGKTLSLLHADPIDTLFLQVQGVKTFRLIPESFKLSTMVDIKQPHKLKYNLNDLKLKGVKVYEMDIYPGTAVFMPAWCFLEIESKNSGLNISLTSHYPRLRKLYHLSPFQIINKIRRFWYPKFVKRKRIRFQLENVSPESVPFFPWFSSHVINRAFESDTTFQHENFLINRRKRKITPINNEYLVSILSQVDGYKTFNEISQVTKVGIDKVIVAAKKMIEDEFIQILFDADDKYNYFYQSIEPKNIRM
jgi:hypothetical protein